MSDLFSNLQGHGYRHDDCDWCITADGIEGNLAWLRFNSRLPTDAQVKLLNKMATAPDLYKELAEQLAPYYTEAQYRQNMENAPCHNGICSIDECGHCARNIRALQVLAKAQGKSDE